MNIIAKPHGCDLLPNECTKRFAVEGKIPKPKTEWCLPKPLVYVDHRFIFICCAFMSGKTMWDWIDQSFFKLWYISKLWVSTLLISASLLEVSPLCFHESHYLNNSGMYFHLLSYFCVCANCDHEVFSEPPWSGHWTPWPENLGYRTQIWDNIRECHFPVIWDPFYWHRLS